MKGLGANISKWRRRQLLTQAELAKKIGVATNTLGSYEIDRREPPLDKLCAIADALKISVDGLLNRETYQPPAVDLVGSLLHAKEYQLDGADNQQIQFFIRLLEAAGYNVTSKDNGDVEIKTPTVHFTNHPHRDFLIEQPRVFMTIQSGIPVCIVMGLKLGAARLADFLDVIRENQVNGFYDKPAPNDTAVADDASADRKPEQPDARPNEPPAEPRDDRAAARPDARPDDRPDDRPDAPPDERPDDQHDENSARK